MFTKSFVSILNKINASVNELNILKIIIFNVR